MPQADYKADSTTWNSLLTATKYVGINTKMTEATLVYQV